MRKASSVVLLFAILIVLPACSTSPSKSPSGSAESRSAQNTAKPADLTTGREEFQRLYVTARGWSPDARPFRLQSETTTDAIGHDGKSGVWRASFAAPSRGSIKTWVWSGIGDPKERGITPGSEDTYNPNNSSTQTFDVAYIKNDSDKAFEVAQQHGGDKLLKENPKLPVFYILDFDSHENTASWHVIYGESRNDAKLKIAVNATTGAFIRKEH